MKWVWSTTIPNTNYEMKILAYYFEKKIDNKKFRKVTLAAF